MNQTHHHDHGSQNQSEVTVVADAMTAKDPVCGMAVQLDQGKPSREHKGQIYHFCSQKCHDKFAADPEHYAPQFGGYCAYAVSMDHVQPADPTIWSIVDDKLYLNLGPGAQTKWQADLSGNIVRASNNWPGALIDPGKRPKSSAASANR